MNEREHLHAYFQPVRYLVVKPVWHQSDKLAACGLPPGQLVAYIDVKGVAQLAEGFWFCNAAMPKNVVNYRDDKVCLLTLVRGPDISTVAFARQPTHTLDEVHCRCL